MGVLGIVVLTWGLTLCSIEPLGCQSDTFEPGLSVLCDSTRDVVPAFPNWRHSYEKEVPEVKDDAL